METDKKSILTRLFEKARASGPAQTMKTLGDTMRGVTRYDSSKNPGSAPEMIRRNLANSGPGPDGSKLSPTKKVPVDAREHTNPVERAISMKGVVDRKAALMKQLKADPNHGWGTTTPKK